MQQQSNPPTFLLHSPISLSLPFFFFFSLPSQSDGSSLHHHQTLLPMSPTIPSSYVGPPQPSNATTTSPKDSISQNFNNIGLGYAIAIALGFLVLLSTILLSSYICCRSAAARRRRRREVLDHNQDANSNPHETSIYLPRIIFVAEDENEDISSENLVVGLDQAVINSYPKFKFSKINGNSNGNGNVNSGGNDTVCAICLCEYKDAEMLRLLPDCKHYFHVTCIDAWLKLNASCPVCRNSPLPTPLSTPLSEVVPLSQYSDGRRRL